MVLKILKGLMLTMFYIISNNLNSKPKWNLSYKQIHIKKTIFSQVIVITIQVKCYKSFKTLNYTFIN